MGGALKGSDRGVGTHLGELILPRQLPPKVRRLRKGGKVDVHRGSGRHAARSTDVRPMCAGGHPRTL